MNINEKIVPYEGIESIKLYQNIDEVKSLLTNSSIQYREEIWQSESETIPNPWNVIIIDNCLSMFFAANKKLFKIVFWNDYNGSLPNGICTGMEINKAKVIDNSLEYNDWNEDYESKLGYWIEDDIETENIMSISIFIKEILDEESFDLCKW